MQSGAVLFFPLFDGEHPSAKASELGQLLLDRLQPFVSLTVRDLSRGFVATLTPVLLVQFLKVSDLGPEPPNLVAKHCQVVHTTRIAHLDWRIQRLGVRSPRLRPLIRNGLAPDAANDLQRAVRKYPKHCMESKTRL